jgi:integrase
LGARNKLAPRSIASLKDGFHSDGGNLFLLVGQGGKRRSWVMRFTLRGKTYSMGLGGADRVTLAEARDKRDELIKLVEQGVNPLAERRRLEAERAAQKSFAEVAEMVLDVKRASGKANSTLASWTRSLKVECASLAERRLDEIGVAEIKRCVGPLFAPSKQYPEGRYVTARACLQRIEAVLGYATTMGWRTGENPARWKGGFERISPERPGGDRHHPSVDWREAPALVAKLRQSPGMAALALEFVILTGVRLSEGSEARWSEIDFDEAVWTIPGERMKRRKPHAVPLSDRAVALLTALREQGLSRTFVFPGDRGRVITRTGVWAQAKRTCGDSASVHGFRATLRSWMADHEVPFEVAESVLAHAGGALKQAYQRSDLCERRRPWMQRWADFLDGKDAANVVPLAAE